MEVELTVIVLSDCGELPILPEACAGVRHPQVQSPSSGCGASGTDLECGFSYEALVEALEAGRLSRKSSGCSSQVFGDSLCLG